MLDESVCVDGVDAGVNVDGHGHGVDEPSEQIRVWQLSLQLGSLVPWRYVQKVVKDVPHLWLSSAYGWMSPLVQRWIE